MSRFLRLLSVLVAVAALASPLLAEEKPPTLSVGYTLEVLSGHEADFEAAMKKQVAWYEKNNETWHWHTWQIETGDDFGKFIFRSPAHHWKDMDERTERGAAARAHFMATVRPHLSSISSGMTQVLPEQSHWPEDLGTVPMVSVYEFRVHYGMGEEFGNTITKIHKAILESEWPLHYAWLATVSGGEQPTFALVIPHKSWADMEGPETPFRAMLEKTLGPAEADAIRASLSRCVRKQTSMLARLRPELSYMPEN